MLVIATAVLAALLSLVASTTIARQKTVTMITNFLAYHAPEDELRADKVRELQSIQIPSSLAFLALIVVTLVQAIQAFGGGIAFLIVVLSILFSPFIQMLIRRRPGSDPIVRGILADLERRETRHNQKGEPRQAQAVRVLIEDIQHLVQLGREAMQGRR